MKVSTYNINSVNARIDNLKVFLEEEKPDVLCLQEIKSEFNNFPFFDIQALGYNVKILGQKSYNGVAVISPHNIEVVAENLPNFPDEQARYLEVIVDFEGKKLRVASVYLPNGNPPYNDSSDNSRFEYKLLWMEALYSHAKKLLLLDENVVLAGDFNVIMTEKDIYDSKIMLGNALYREEVKQRLKAIEYLGFYDAYRTLYPDEIGYTYWDYSGNAFNMDFGMRIDYVFLSPCLVDKLQKCYVDKKPRKMEKPSDHTVLTVEIDL